ncbi:MAG: fibronectin type III domain-containing protein, partial [Bacteroidota bacterium]
MKNKYLSGKTKIFKNAAWLFLVFFSFNAAFGQLSGCATSGAAGQLTVGTNCTFTTFNSTFNTDYWNSATGCGATDDDDAWGWFDATSTTTIITYNSSDDAILHLFTGACSPTMTSVACADNTTSGNETITYSTTIGVRYLVRIQRDSSNNNMSGTICIYSPPVNDICSGAVTLTVNPTLTCTTSTTGSTSGATANNETGDCTTGTEKAVWYKFTATNTSHIITVDGIAGFNAVVGAITTCGSATTPTGGICTDATLDDGIETLTLTGLTSGITYYVQVYDFNGDTTSNGFTICVTTPTPCTTPTAQPTTLTFNTFTSTSVNGTFTAASPAASGYLIVRSSSATPPTLTNGTTYAVGVTTLTPGTTRVIQGSAVTSNSVSFSDSGLTSNTKYYYHIFSYNNGCTGEPYYLSTSPLTNSATTCPVAPTLPVNSAITGSGFTVTWTASAAGGNAAPIDYILEVYTDAGFTIPVAGSPFSVGTPITYTLAGLNTGITYYYRIKANNESCDSNYLPGNATTTLSNDICSQAIALTVNPSLTCSASTTGSTLGSTDNNETGDCTTGAEKAVWYKFTATNTTHYITVDGIAGFDVVVGALNTCGSATTPTGGGCTNATGDNGIETLTLTGLTVGVTYYVQVYDSNGDNTSNAYTICVTTPAPPLNNQCVNATTLPCSTSNLAGTTANASSYIHGTGCLMSNYGVWYTFTGDGNSSTISVTTTTNDIELSISIGSCGSLTNIACQDTALSNGTETYTFTTAVGVNYYVYIANWYSAGTSTDTGAFTISRTCVVPYDPCTTISNIAACGSATSVTIPSGTGGYSPSSCGWTTPGVEKIYTFTPASTGNFTITQTSSFDYINYQFKPVSSGCSSSGWTCIDELDGAGTSSSFTLTAGTQYYILLDPEVSTGGSVNFTINCPTTALVNDD